MVQRLKKIVLIGYMGSGKSAVGRELAMATGFTPVETDNLVEAECSLPIAYIFREKGEVFFRKAEQKALVKALEAPENSVVITGGGTPCYGDNMDRILQWPDTKTVCLKAGIATLAGRLFPTRHTRPLIAHIQTEEALREFIGKHLFERMAYYSRADMMAETDGKTPGEIVGDIVAYRYRNNDV